MLLSTLTFSSHITGKFFHTVICDKLCEKGYNVINYSLILINDVMKLSDWLGRAWSVVNACQNFDTNVFEHQSVYLVYHEMFPQNLSHAGSIGNTL